MAKKVIVTDGISEYARKQLEQKGYTVDLKKGISPEDLKKEIKEYNAIIVRSATKVTKDIIDNADNLEVIGRAGVGVDNIDLDAATKKGVVVVNAPTSNSVSVAEHTIGLMFAASRNIARAHKSLVSGKWEKSKFKGIELDGKTLGVIGLGKIGFLVAKKAIGLGMKVIAFDPFSSEDRFKQIGIKRADKLEDIYEEADFITIHMPKNKDTIGMFDKNELYKMKKGTILINVARGGIIVEKDLIEALESGQIGGAAIDVYEKEPCTESGIFDFDTVVCTPHLGASTVEAQDRAGTQIADQVDAVFNGKIAPFVVNIPSVEAESMEAISPFFDLCNNMGSLFAGMFEGNLDNIEVCFYGKISEYDTNLLTSMILVKIMEKYSEESVNFVNVRLLTEENGLKIKEVKSSQSKDYINLVTLNGKGRDSEISISGTVTGIKNTPRFISIDRFAIDMVPSNHMAFIRYKDVPGQIGKIGNSFGKLDVNIAAMHVGREKVSGEAVMGLNLDSEVTAEMKEEFIKLSGFNDIKIINL